MDAEMRDWYIENPGVGTTEIKAAWARFSREDNRLVELVDTEARTVAIVHLAPGGLVYEKQK